MDPELLLHGSQLLLPRQVYVSPAVHFLQVSLFDCLGVVLIFDLIDIREVLIKVPRIEIIHLCYELFQELDAPLELSELLDAELLDDSLLEGVLLDV